MVRAWILFSCSVSFWYMAASCSSKVAFVPTAAGAVSAAVVVWPANVSGCSEMVGGALFRLLLTALRRPPVELSVALPLELTELFLGFFFFCGFDARAGWVGGWVVRMPLQEQGL